MHIQEWLETIPAVSIYLLVGLVIGLESLGIPLPGEIILVSSALLASQHGEIDPVVLGVCASTGAIVGDSIGYAIGRRGGKPLLEKLGRRFPKHFGPEHVALAERSFDRWGMWAVFFGRFVALLRIFAGPLAGVLHMPYWRFLIANILGGILWAGGTTAVIYSVGVVAEPWLKRFSWAALALAVLFGLVVTLVMRSRMKKAARSLPAPTSPAEDAASPVPAPTSPAEDAPPATAIDAAPAPRATISD
ncbi:MULTISPECIES: DedA family protein [unclassified Streptomyces]|uniref:DedA family protein n=1 Tax=unclassified Streptomyces TaxID=2593676 RepID=UPI00225A395B|nr:MULTISPECIES: VTT domain-containing protein [unclassified Streptomyces]MCX4529061.1 VTT domain-containing protein [Streptomyces sp. NBC_01551]MCX4540256.1 VTT domain-containing protein [Streptomyces sp. NBC_01565]